MWGMTPQNLAAFHQYLTTVVGCFSFVIVGSAVGWPSPILIMMQNHEAPVSLNTEQISWMVSLMYLGHFMSPIPSGIMMDKFGRKRSCLLLAFLPLTSWLMIWLTTSPVCLYIARYIAGLWAGGVSTIIPMYVGEIAEPRLRGSLISLNHLMRNLGLLLVYIMGSFVSYATLAMSCAAVTLVFIISFAFMPESPYYLLMKNRENEAYKNLNWLRGERGSPSVDEELVKIKTATNKQLQEKGSFKDVWCNTGNRKAFIISQVLAVTKRLTGAGVLQAYVSVTLPPLTFGLFSPDDCVIILGTVSLISATASVFLSVHFNRRTLLTFSSAGCSLTMFIVSVWFYLRSNTSFNVVWFSDWLFISFIIYNMMFSLGLGPIGTSAKGELFAANVKALCSALTTMVVAFTAFILNKFFLLIAEYFGMHINFLIYAISCIFVIIFTWLYIPETQGKSLEEVQRLLQGVEKQPRMYTEERVRETKA